MDLGEELLGPHGTAEGTKRGKEVENWKGDQGEGGICSNISPIANGSAGCRFVTYVYDPRIILFYDYNTGVINRYT